MNFVWVKGFNAHGVRSGEATMKSKADVRRARNALLFSFFLWPLCHKDDGKQVQFDREFFSDCINEHLHGTDEVTVVSAFKVWIYQAADHSYWCKHTLNLVVIITQGFAHQASQLRHGRPIFFDELDQVSLPIPFLQNVKLAAQK